jgi:hypothetical protein
MCYETYERLLRARAARRASERPERKAPEPEARKDTPAEPVTADKAREKEPA